MFSGSAGSHDTEKNSVTHFCAKIFVKGIDNE